MSEMLQNQSGRNAPVDLDKMENQAVEAQRADTSVPETPISQFGGPGSSPAPSGGGAARGDSDAVGEMALHVAAAALGPLALAATAAASVAYQAYWSSRPDPKSSKIKSISPLTATGQTITPGRVTTNGGKKSVVNSRYRAKQKPAGDDTAASIFITRQSMFSPIKGVQVQTPRGADTVTRKPMATAQHLMNIGAIRREKAQGPQIVADARMQSHDVYAAAARGDDVVLDNLGDHAPQAKALPQQQPSNSTN